MFSNILHLVFRCVVLERREAASGIISQMDTSDLLKNMSYQRLSCAQGNDCHCCRLLICRTWEKKKKNKMVGGGEGGGVARFLDADVFFAEDL